MSTNGGVTLKEDEEHEIYIMFSCTVWLKIFLKYCTENLPGDIQDVVHVDKNLSLHIIVILDQWKATAAFIKGIPRSYYMAMSLTTINSRVLAWPYVNMYRSNIITDQLVPIKPSCLTL